MTPTVTWLGHASFKISGTKTVYIDPWQIAYAPHDADIILISHNHYDHFSIFDIERVSKPTSMIFAPASVIDELKRGNPFRPGDHAQGEELSITGIPAYHKNSPVHPRQKDWLGFFISMGGKTIYYAGDTNIIQEMQTIGHTDLMLVPINGIHTLTPKTALKACSIIHPVHAIPYQWGNCSGPRQRHSTSSVTHDRRRHTCCSPVSHSPSDRTLPPPHHLRSRDAISPSNIIR